MSKIYTLLALVIVLSLVSAGSALARDGQGLAGNSNSAFKASSSGDNRNSVVISGLTDYRQDDPAASGENARILVTGPLPEAMAKSYKAGTLIGGFIGTESEGAVRANPELGEYGPVLPVGAAF